MRYINYLGPANRLLLGWACVLIVLLASTAASANFAGTPWIHDLAQEGQDVRITIQVFEEASAELVHETFEFPGLETRYTVTRFGDGPQETVVDQRLFPAGDAIEVTPNVCHTDEGSDAECTEPCAGFCAVAYRFEVVDECAPVGYQYYQVTIPAIAADPTYADEGLGTAAITVTDYAGDSCFDDKTGICSVAAVGRGAPCGCAALLVLLGVGVLAFRRWRG